MKHSVFRILCWQLLIINYIAEFTLKWACSAEIDGVSRAALVSQSDTSVSPQSIASHILWCTMTNRQIEGRRFRHVQNITLQNNCGGYAMSTESQRLDIWAEHRLPGDVAKLLLLFHGIQPWSKPHERCHRGLTSVPTAR